MNLIAVKAAELRAKYIVDKYHYGVNCNKCNYDYIEAAMQDFISQCYNVCVTIDDVKFEGVGTNVTSDSPVDDSVSVDCSIIIAEQSIPACTAPTITNCKGNITIEVNNVELDDYVVTETETNTNTLAFDIHYLKLDGEYIVLNPEPLIISSATIDKNNYGLFTNFVTYINTLQDKVVFEVAQTKNRIRITYPEGSRLELKTNYSTLFSADTKGVIITHNGLQAVKETNTSLYTKLWLNPTYVAWTPAYQLINTQSLC